MPIQGLHLVCSQSHDVLLCTCLLWEYDLIRGQIGATALPFDTMALPTVWYCLAVISFLFPLCYGQDRIDIQLRKLKEAQDHSHTYQRVGQQILQTQFLMPSADSFLAKEGYRNSVASPECINHTLLLIGALERYEMWALESE